MTCRTLFPLLAAVLAISLDVAPAMASWSPWDPAVSSDAADTSQEGEPRLAQAGCSGAAAQAAAQSGGQVLSVQTVEQGGRTVCIVTVLVPARDGSRPRRQTITIAQ